MKKFYFQKINYIQLKSLIHFHLILNLNLIIIIYFKKSFKNRTHLKRKKEEEEEVINRPTNPKEKNHPNIIT